MFISLFLSGCNSQVNNLNNKISDKIGQNKQKIVDFQDSIAPEPSKILISGLPNKHLINTSFVQQAPEKNWDQPWQDTCEEAAILTVDYYYKNQKPNKSEIKNDLLKMIEYEHQQNWTKDINIFQMAQIGSSYLGYKTEIIEDPTIETIKQKVAENIPIIIPANGKILYEENKHFKDGGPYYHNLVILGYDDNRQQFIVHDVGTQFGAYYKYSYQLLIQSIHDFPETNIKQDINNGHKRVLILLK